MNRNYLMALFLLSTFVLTGCETLKSTISGPFIGMQKDGENFSKAVNQKSNSGDGQNSIQKLDEWMRKNMW